MSALLGPLKTRVLGAVSAGDAREAPERDHAQRLLSSSGFAVGRVVRVDVDSVLYVTPAGRPRTAWLSIEDRALLIHDEPGFSAEQPARAGDASAAQRSGPPIRAT